MSGKRVYNLRSPHGRQIKRLICGQSSAGSDDDSHPVSISSTVQRARVLSTSFPNLIMRRAPALRFSLFTNKFARHSANQPRGFNRYHGTERTRKLAASANKTMSRLSCISRLKKGDEGKKNANQYELLIKQLDCAPPDKAKADRGISAAQVQTMIKSKLRQ